MDIREQATYLETLYTQKINTPWARRRSGHLRKSPAMLPSKPPTRSENLEPSSPDLPCFGTFQFPFQISQDPIFTAAVHSKRREKWRLLEENEKLQKEREEMQKEIRKVHQDKEASQEVTLAFNRCDRQTQADTSATGDARYHSPYIA